MKLIFIRHGHPDYKTDSLTELGICQVKAAAERLSDFGITKIYSSPLGRAKQTAEISAEKLNLNIKTLDFMREISWGIEGSTREEKGKYHPWNTMRSLAVTGTNLLTHDYSKLKTWKGTLFEQSFNNKSKSLDDWLLELGFERDGCYYRCIKENEDTIAVFAHAGSIACVMAHLLSLPAPYIVGYSGVEMTGITVFNFNNEVGNIVVPHLLTFNEHSHIFSCKTENIIQN